MLAIFAFSPMLGSLYIPNLLIYESIFYVLIYLKPFIFPECYQKMII